MSSKTALFVLLAGIAMIMGSCAPFLVAAHRGLNVHTAYTHPLAVGRTLRSASFNVDTEHYLRLGIHLKVETPSLRHTTTGNRNASEPLYRFPVEYVIYDDTNRRLYKANTLITSDSGSRTVRDKAVGPDSAVLDVEHGLDKFRIKQAGPIRVSVRLEPDTVYKATVRQADLFFYDNVYRHGKTLLLGFVIGLAGVLVAAVGVILIIAKAASRSPPAAAAETAPEADNSIRNLAMWCHLGALAGYLIPFGGLIGPLVIWLSSRERHPFIDDQGKEAINFRLSMYLYYLISIVLCFIVIGFFFLALLSIADLVLVIIAAVQANTGERFRYPVAIRLIR